MILRAYATRLMLFALAGVLAQMVEWTFSGE